MLRIFNTSSGQEENLEPLVPGRVSMYACGVTVYDLSHIGHARSALVFDVIRSYLEFEGYRVTYVRNFTDIDDKIIARAAQEGKSPETVAKGYLQAYREDMVRLGVHPADIEPKATEHIPDIIRLIDRLVEKGHAYHLDGDVYFEVATFPGYGRLSKRRIEELVAGARVEVDERKRSPMDFALWKSSKPGEPAWESPWGSGRPGWHIECSAMSMRHLGETFDIHGGGMDLIFPHHENEIAQSCGATGLPFARYWLHNGFVQINQEKMSKSLGNFFTIREIFQKSEWDEKMTGEVLRYFLLATHYRSPLDFSDQGLLATKSALDAFYGLFLRLEECPGTEKPGDSEVDKLLDSVDQAFRRSMNDDLNTPGAIGQLQYLRGEANRLLTVRISQHPAERILRTFRHLGSVLRLFQLSPRGDWQFNPRVKERTGREAGEVGPPDGARTTPALSDQDIERYVAERNEARRQKDFKKADEIRAVLKEHGITLEDRPDGTTRWKR